MAEQPPFRFERTWDAATIRTRLRLPRARRGEPGLGERRRSHPAAPGAGQARLRHARRLERSGPALRTRPTRRRASTSSPSCTSGDWVGVTGDVMKTRRGELSVKVHDVGAARRGAAAVPRQVARPHRRRHALPPALRRPVGHRGGAAHLRRSAAASCRSPGGGSKTVASSRSRRRSSIRSRVARSPSRSSRTTTRSTSTSTCASHPSCT